MARRHALILGAALLCAILLLVLARGARAEALARIDEDPTGAPYVSGELLVAYEPGTSEKAEETAVRGSGARTLESPSGENLRLLSFPSVEDEASQGARERALEQKLQEIRDEPRVAAVDYNYVRGASFVPNDPKFADQWGLAKASFPGAWDTARGTGARIAVVDSGVDQGHPDIGNIAAQKDFVERDRVADDDNGHGTHVTGIAAALTNNGIGVAGGCPDCDLLIAKVIGRNGETTDAKIVDGMSWSVQRGADVVNLSLGGPGDSSVLQKAVNDAVANGVVVVAAAGNERTTKRQYPAAYPAAIAVSATNKKDELARFSSRGKWIDLAAPGTSILSTLDGGGYGEMTGTSMSAPFVSALAGLLASRGIYTGDQIRQQMESTATDLGPAGVDPYYGHGRIDAASAVQ